MANQITKTSVVVENAATVSAILHPLLALFYAHLVDLLLRRHA